MAYLFFVIVSLLLYIVYENVASRKEREKLQLKLMSKNVEEYKLATEPEPKVVVPEEEEDDYAEPENVPLGKLMKAKDTL